MQQPRRACHQSHGVKNLKMSPGVNWGCPANRRQQSSPSLAGSPGATLQMEMQMTQKQKKRAEEAQDDRMTGCDSRQFGSVHM